MPSETQESKIGWPTAVGVTFLLLLKTAVLISDSYLFGRLAIPPPHDDVSYFVDALERINVFRSVGLRGVIAGMMLSPPHAPYSTLAAFAGFLVSGGARPAPYVVNALVVAGLTLFWLVMFRVGPISAWLVAVLIISTAWFDNAVTIFHPDLIAGYGAAIVASLAIFQHEVLTTTRRMVVAGAVAGLVLLIKPAALSMVLALWGVAFVAGMLASRAMGVTFLASLRRSWILVLPLAAIAGPYFGRELLPILRYNYLGFVTQYSTWIRLSAGANPWTFYLFRSAELFGRWLYWGPVALTIVAIAVVRGCRALIFCFGGLLTCLVSAYVVPTVIPIKVMLFGGILYGMVLVTGLITLTRLPIFPPLPGRMAALSRTSQAVYATILLVIFAIVAGGETKDGQGHFPAGTLQSSAQYDRIYSILRGMAVGPTQGSGSSRHISAYFPTVYVAPLAYQFRALEEGLDISVDQGPFETDPDRVFNSARTADIVLIPDGRLLSQYFPYPVNALLGEVVERLRKDATMVEGAPVELPDGAMLIFRKRRPA